MKYKLKKWLWKLKTSNQTQLTLKRRPMLPLDHIRIGVLLILMTRSITHAFTKGNNFYQVIWIYDTGE